MKTQSVFGISPDFYQQNQCPFMYSTDGNMYVKFRYKVFVFDPRWDMPDCCIQSLLDILALHLEQISFRLIVCLGSDGAMLAWKVAAFAITVALGASLGQLLLRILLIQNA
jgi:hypothetical protein